MSHNNALKRNDTKEHNRHGKNNRYKERLIFKKNYQKAKSWRIAINIKKTIQKQSHYDHQEKIIEKQDHQSY